MDFSPFPLSASMARHLTYSRQFFLIISTQLLIQSVLVAIRASTSLPTLDGRTVIFPSRTSCHLDLSIFGLVLPIRRSSMYRSDPVPIRLSFIFCGLANHNVLMHCRNQKTSCGQCNPKYSARMVKTSSKLLTTQEGLKI